MKTKFYKTVLWFVCLSMLSSRAFAVNDPVNTLLHFARFLESKVEAVYNTTTNLQLQDIYKLMGEKGRIKLSFAEGKLSELYAEKKSSLVDYKEFAPTVKSDLQSILDRGYDAIPDLRKYAEREFKVLSSSDVNKQAEVLVQINERLNISAMDALQRAKNIAAVTNGDWDSADKQLKLSGKAHDLQHKFVQEAAQDIESFKRDVALNQIAAQFLEAQVTNYIAARQHSTPDIEEALAKLSGGLTRGGGDDDDSSDKPTPLKYSAETGFPEEWGKVVVVPCGTFFRMQQLKDEGVAYFNNSNVVSNLRSDVEGVIDEYKTQMDDKLAKMLEPENLADDSDVVEKMQKAYDDMMETLDVFFVDTQVSASMSFNTVYNETASKLWEIAGSSGGGAAFFEDAAQDVVAAAEAKLDELFAAYLDEIDSVSNTASNALDGMARNAVSVATNGQSTSSSSLPKQVRTDLSAMNTKADREVASRVSDLKKDAKSLLQRYKANLEATIKDLKVMIRRGEV